MKGIRKLLGAVLLLTICALLFGCAMTVEQMYCLPRRSERYESLQKLMEQTMGGAMSYSAPISGENRQTVQMADLDGDGNQEVVLFARGNDKDPLKILLFSQRAEGFEQVGIIESAGKAFDQVEYAQMDGRPGMELIVGRQVGDQVLGNVCVYSFTDGKCEQIMSANYRKFLVCDLDEDGLSDLFVLHPGIEEGDRGLAELYCAVDGWVERSAEAELSESVDHLKRIMTGRLQSGEAAVFVASTAGEQSIITDVYAIVNGVLENVSFSNESGTSVKTLRNYYVYADDIDQDQILEIPSLIPMRAPEEMEETAGQHLIRWYGITASGDEVDKMFTFHCFLGGWYLELEERLAYRLYAVEQTADNYSFYLWDEEGTNAQLMFTISAITGEELSESIQGRLILLKTDSVVYTAELEPAAIAEGFTQEYLEKCFHLIQYDWKTGEM